jgi:HAMP domain-containing protein
MIGIREKMLAAFVVLSLVPLVFLGSISGYEMNRVGRDSVKESTDALDAQARTHLTRLAQDKAGISNDFFVAIEKDTGALQAYANDVFSNRERYGGPNYPAYRYARNLAANLPAYGFVNTSMGNGNGAWADWDHQLASSPYLNRSVVSRAASDPQYGAWVSAEMNSTLLLDKVLRPTYEKNRPNVVATWFVRSGGISTSYQQPVLDWGQLLSSGQRTPEWDESQEDYFRAAMIGPDPQKKPVWVGPYYDPVGNGWMISCVAPIYRLSEFIGVTGIDVTLDVVVDTVLGVSFLESGHAFLINRNGEAIAHRDLVQAMVNSSGRPVPIGSLESDSSAFGALTQNMRSGSNGIQKVKYADKMNYYVAFSPVSSPGFSLGVVVAENEISRPVRDTQDTINALTSTTITQVVLVDIAAITVAMVVGAVIARKIVRPIKKLTDLASKIGTGEIDESIFTSGALVVEPELTGRPDEIGELAKSFESMINAVREDIKKTPKSQIRIEIKDSVISRSFTDMGTPSAPVDTKETIKAELAAGTAEVVEMKDAALSDEVIARDGVAPDKAAPASSAEGIKICPYCGKELNFPKPPKFCPYCKELLS